MPTHMLNISTKFRYDIISTKYRHIASREISVNTRTDARTDGQTDNRNTIDALCLQLLMEICL